MTGDDAAVMALGDVLYESNPYTVGHNGMAETVLDALPDLLRQRSPAGQVLRERLGLRLSIRGVLEDFPVAGDAVD